MVCQNKFWKTKIHFLVQIFEIKEKNKMEKKIEFGIGEGVYYLDWTDEHKISHSTVWRKSVCVTANGKYVPVKK